MATRKHEDDSENQPTLKKLAVSKERVVLNDLELSELPDEILLKILHSLPKFTATSMSVLSKRWRNLVVNMWDETLKIKLDLVDSENDGGAYVEMCMRFLDQVLLRRCNDLPPTQRCYPSEPPRLNKFVLRCENHHGATIFRYLENFIIRVLKLRVRELKFLLPDFPDISVLSRWSAFYTCEQITKIDIEGCFFEIPRFLPNLKVLYLKVEGNEVTGITSLSQYRKLEKLTIIGDIASDMDFVLPVLEYLNLGFNHLHTNNIEIDTPHLKELKIEEDQEGQCGEYLVRGTSDLAKSTFILKNPYDHEVDIDIIELTPTAKEAIENWLRAYHQLECLEFVGSDTEFIFGDGTKFNLILTLCEEQKLNLLRNTVTDLRVINVVMDYPCEGNSYVLSGASTKLFKGEQMCIRVACRQILHMDCRCSVSGDPSENLADINDDVDSFSDSDAEP